MFLPWKKYIASFMLFFIEQTRYYFLNIVLIAKMTLYSDGVHLRESNALIA